MSDVCPQCGSSNLGSNEGSFVCFECGAVIEEDNIVSDVTFAEGADGASNVIGQFVSESGTVHGRGLPGTQRQNREITIANGRRRIAVLAGSLRIRGEYVDQAARVYQLAVQHNFTQGRKTQHVCAACLYLICRRNKTYHMLIDFSDVLQTNVYVLGHTFLKLCRLVHLDAPVIDPSLYIHRFAAQLEFGDKQNDVTNTALRLVQRMRRDWIQTGRRPAGICGAALLIAGKLHGFRRTQREIIHVVKICDVTLRKRLDEFETTPTADLTPEEFENTDLETECDPPAFTRNRTKEEASRAEQSEAEEQKKSAKRTGSGTGKRKVAKASAAAVAAAAALVNAAAEEDKEENQREKNAKKRKEAAQPAAKKGTRSSKRRKQADDEEEQPLTVKDLVNRLQDDDGIGPISAAQIEQEMQEALAENGPTLSNMDASSLNKRVELTPDGAPTQPSEDSTTQANSVDPNAPAKEGETKEVKEDTFSDIDDDELDMYINTEQESEVKAMLWDDLNREYLDRQAEKEAEAAELAKNGKPKRKVTRRKDKTAADGEKVDKRPSKSAKINYANYSMEHIWAKMQEDQNEIKEMEEKAAAEATQYAKERQAQRQSRRMISSLGDSLLPVSSSSIQPAASTDVIESAPAPAASITAGGHYRAPAALSSVAPRLSATSAASGPAGDDEDDDDVDDEDDMEGEEQQPESFRAQFFGVSEQQDDYADEDEYDY